MCKKNRKKLLTGFDLRDNIIKSPRAGAVKSDKKRKIKNDIKTLFFIDN